MKLLADIKTTIVENIDAEMIEHFNTNFDHEEAKLKENEWKQLIHAEESKFDFFTSDKHLIKIDGHQKYSSINQCSKPQYSNKRPNNRNNQTSRRNYHFNTQYRMYNNRNNWKEEPINNENQWRNINRRNGSNAGKRLGLYFDRNYHREMDSSYQQQISNYRGFH